MQLLCLWCRGATINRRADIILGDDIVDKENASTLLQREKLKSWFWESVVPILEPRGQVGGLRTRYHSKELYEDLIRLLQDVYTPMMTQWLTPPALRGGRATILVFTAVG